MHWGYTVDHTVDLILKNLGPDHGKSGSYGQVHKRRSYHPMGIIRHPRYVPNPNSARRNSAVWTCPICMSKQRNLLQNMFCQVAAVYSYSTSDSTVWSGFSRPDISHYSSLCLFHDSDMLWPLECVGLS